MKRQSSGFALQNRNGSGLRVLAEEAEECNACCQIKEKRFTTSLALSLSLSLSLFLPIHPEGLALFTTYRSLL